MDVSPTAYVHGVGHCTSVFLSLAQHLKQVVRAVGQQFNYRPNPLNATFKMGFNCWGQCVQSKLSLNFPDRDRFDQSQWCGSDRVSIWYMLYRIFVAVFFIVFTICHITRFPDPAKWIIFMTDQGIALLSVHFILDACIVTTRWIQERRHGVRDLAFGRIPLLYQISWALGTCFSNAALVITLIYWLGLHKFVEEYGLLTTSWDYYLNFFVHALNTIFCLVDMFLSNRPYRLLHFYLPIGYGVFYVLFSLIYWGAGGLGLCNEDGCVNYIYPILDYSGHPWWAVATVAIALVVIPIGQCIWFGLFKLRLLIAAKFVSETP
eukprot:maker-scaffold403_size186359-snap-gene-0.46 protein:Tk07448 transcript:maker-scaffold403_size186359-snap-gene-0.46-mRNA-1 annotation:"rolling stone"